jgi:hypothetical protein
VVVSRIDEFFVPGQFPNLNRIIALRASTYRGAYSAEKRKWEKTVAACAHGIEPWTVPAFIHFDMREPNRRADPDGRAGGTMKFCCDGLVNCGILKDDGWKYIAGLSFVWSVDKDNPGVYVTLSEERIK